MVNCGVIYASYHVRVPSFECTDRQPSANNADKQLERSERTRQGSASLIARASKGSSLHRAPLASLARFGPQALLMSKGLQALPALQPAQQAFRPPVASRVQASTAMLVLPAVSIERKRRC